MSCSQEFVLEREGVNSCPQFSGLGIKGFGWRFAECCGCTEKQTFVSAWRTGEGISHKGNGI